MSESKVLIIDDELLTCQLIAKVLTLQGYNTVVLTELKRIMEVVLEEEPSLILLDYHLGSTHGLEVLQKLRTNNVNVPVIMTSGINYEQEALEAGSQAFLLKPFDWKELMAIIKDLLSAT